MGSADSRRSISRRTFLKLSALVGGMAAFGSELLLQMTQLVAGVLQAAPQLVVSQFARDLVRCSCTATVE